MSDGLAKPMIQIAARTLHLTNDVTVLRCTVGNRQWLLGDDPEIEAAFATLNRKLREMAAQMKAIEDVVPHALHFGRFSGLIRNDQTLAHLMP